MSENSEEASEDVVEKNQGTTEPEEKTDNEISLLENNPVDPPAMLASKKWPNKKADRHCSCRRGFRHRRHSLADGLLTPS